ncbi:MAG TPA: hypothetical protein VJ698_04890 [Noviherbaspirillum sp.]|uniref:hypothetical protein n=1 Tax=Noviherbaspirillum sp. TaxID=1926288 RepID=UPI002B49F296|nr:hypothetical protein [Noviherbaspirillum sp.]HJV84791.1 hypothetical protein [Noviherbaspirillum sp.]
MQPNSSLRLHLYRQTAAAAARVSDAASPVVNAAAPDLQSTSVTPPQSSHSGSIAEPPNPDNQAVTERDLQPIDQALIDAVLAQSPTFNKFSPNDRQVIGMVFSNLVFYHGTCTTSKTSIQEYGFDLSRQTSGPTAGLVASKRGAAMLRQAPQEEIDEFISNARSYHFVTSDKDEAKAYARRTDSSDPALVRVGIDENSVSLEPDPDQLDADEMENVCFRTKDPIPSTYVFPSKSKGASNANSGTGTALHALFQTRLAENGVAVSDEDIGKLFHDLQSDSEDDFSSGSDWDSDSDSENISHPSH